MRAISRRNRPTTPGEILREEFLIPRDDPEAAGGSSRLRRQGCQPHRERSNVRHCAVALKLGATFWTTPEFWRNAQKAVDLHHAARHLPSLPKPLL